MFEHFTEPSRRVVMIAQQEARQLGHQWVGTEHLLLGVAVQDDQWAALVLARRGLTAARIRNEIERITGHGVERPAVAPGIDAAALATLGIDLDAVRRRVEATFGPGALARNPGGRCGSQEPAIPFTPRAKKALELGLRECVTQRHDEITPHDLVLGLLGSDGTAAQILHEHGVTAEAFRTSSHGRRRRRFFRRRSDHLA